MTTPADVTQEGIDALVARGPVGAEVTGEYDAELGGLGCWTWVIVVTTPTPTAEDQAATSTQGVSRQYVATPSDPAPSTEYLGLMITEMLSTFGGTA